MAAQGKTIQLGVFGSIIFGLVLSAAGFALKKFVVDSGILSGDDAVTMGRAAIGVMMVGGLIVVGNIAWIGFCVFMARRQ